MLRIVVAYSEQGFPTALTEKLLERLFFSRGRAIANFVGPVHPVELFVPFVRMKVVEFALLLWSQFVVVNLQCFGLNRCAGRSFDPLQDQFPTIEFAQSILVDDRTGIRRDDFAKVVDADVFGRGVFACLLYTSPSPRDATLSRMPSSA